MADQNDDGPTRLRLGKGNSKTPIVRAGVANLLLPVVVIVSWINFGLIYEVLGSKFAATIVAVVTAFLLLRVYLSFSSHVIETNEQLQWFDPIRERKLEVADIEDAQLVQRVFSASTTAKMEIRVRGIARPVIIRFALPPWEFDAVEKMESKLHDFANAAVLDSISDCSRHMLWAGEAEVAIPNP